MLTLFLASVLALLPEPAQDELTRCNVDAAALERYLALDYQAFDQDIPDGGWRGLSNQEGCGRAAAELIKAYILYSEGVPPESIRILRWHAGQVLAGAGDTAEAVAFFKGSYAPAPEDGEADPWNLYVDATLAFLANDRPALQAAHDRLAALPVSEETKAARRTFLADNPNITMPDGFVDKPQNLAVVEGFLACFGKPYEEAYGPACR